MRRGREGLGEVKAKGDRLNGRKRGGMKVGWKRGEGGGEVEEREGLKAEVTEGGLQRFRPSFHVI